MRPRTFLRLLVLAPLLIVAGCVCCPESADQAGLPARVDMDEPASAR